MSKELVLASVNVLWPAITKQKKNWVRKWVTKRSKLDASATLLKKLASENLLSYKNILCMPLILLSTSSTSCL